MIAHILAASGKRVGRAGPEGMFVGGRRQVAGHQAGPEGARAVLLNPAVDAAVLEDDQERILNEGLGFDLCDVAVLADPGATEAGRVLVGSVAPGGSLVLEASDARTPAMAGLARVPVVLASLDPGSPALLDHARQGGRSVFDRDGALILAVGASEVARLGWKRPGGDPMQSEAALAAASAWCLGIDPPAIAEALASFKVQAG